jgi:hypothetical protein
MPRRCMRRRSDMLNACKVILAIIPDVRAVAEDTFRDLLIQILPGAVLQMMAETARQQHF